MTFRPAFLIAASAVLVTVSTVDLHAQGAPVRFLVSNGMKAAIEELRPQCERAIGRPLDIQFHSWLEEGPLLHFWQGRRQHASIK
jgi:hypothetical protein